MEEHEALRLCPNRLYSLSYIISKHFIATCSEWGVDLYSNSNTLGGQPGFFVILCLRYWLIQHVAVAAGAGIINSMKLCDVVSFTRISLDLCDPFLRSGCAAGEKVSTGYVWKSHLHCRIPPWSSRSEAPTLLADSAVTFTLPYHNDHGICMSSLWRQRTALAIPNMRHKHSHFRNQKLRILDPLRQRLGTRVGFFCRFGLDIFYLAEKIWIKNCVVDPAGFYQTNQLWPNFKSHRSICSLINYYDEGPPMEGSLMSCQEQPRQDTFTCSLGNVDPVVHYPDVAFCITALQDQSHHHLSNPVIETYRNTWGSISLDSRPWFPKIDISSNDKT